MAKATLCPPSFPLSSGVWACLKNSSVFTLQCGRERVIGYLDNYFQLPERPLA